MGAPGYRRKLQQAALDREISVQTLLDRAVEQYLSAGSTTAEIGPKRTLNPLAEDPSVVAESKGSPGSKRAFATLRTILESGHTKAIAAIRQNLDAFEELVDRARGVPFGIVDSAFEREDQDRLKDEKALRSDAAAIGKRKRYPRKRRGAS